MTNQWARWLQVNEMRPFVMASKLGWHEFVNSGPRAPLTLLTTTERAALTPRAREDYDEARMVWNMNPPTVRTSQLNAAFATIDQVMASNRRDGDRLRGSVVIDAAPALGKTTIATRYGREFHRKAIRRYGAQTNQRHQRIPVAFIPLDAGITLKGLNQKILSFYGHPAANRATTSRLGALAVDCVRSCETRIMILDDLHFVDFKHKNGSDVSNHLKGLANEMPVTFIYVGVHLAQKQFFGEGRDGRAGVQSQTARRATRVGVAPFSIATDASAHAWRRLLAAIEPHLLLANSEPNMLVEQAVEIFRRTQGHFGSLTNLLDRASYLAITTGAERITPEIVREVTIDNAAELLSVEKPARSAGSK